jgi:hypothetical protein
MDTETLLFLLKGGHINSAERIEKGIWPHPPLKLSELISVIVNHLKSNRWFPYPWVEKKNDDLIDDVSVIEKIDKEKFIYYSRSAQPINLSKIGENTKRIFKTAQSAAEYYLRNALRLPGNLDSWKVIDK